MSKLRHDQKRDANEPEIVEGLEAIGCTVDRQPGGDGRPDLIVGDDDGGRIEGYDVRMEVKVDGEQLNVKQRKYHAAWKGQKIHVVFSLQQAISIIAWNRRQRRKA